MSTERRKLSLGAVSERANASSGHEGSKTSSWNLSAARAESIKDRARDMRRNPTPVHAALWERLKDKQLGFGFNQQVVMGSAVVDFACKPRWLVIEIGGTGDDADATLAQLSDRKLTEVGVRVLRFSEEQVFGEIDAVTARIKEELNKPFERPGAKPARSSPRPQAARSQSPRGSSPRSSNRRDKPYASNR